ncbi:DNA polymerase III subunit alpha [Ponticaulis sp.]|uniref:DNA polymerase III subunit alpha n=1 Tax=Ponticaulis sp. TaxID=2020902 RepID=UPI000B6E5953|nr:DNA polymerase III subunit alpha [Ponticaulis sp.]MAI89446.1 DNA polymerase III subunit alpha [Ponticaulis sp.]OUY00484.1 MAG: DNA polymerase III subunit alpha [Hyphomonadaceae bacterium TMED5]|tara:strand:- start:93943 stop:97368 length:3426 start_codon:yes stop_codon:yes gene_type:complete
MSEAYRKPEFIHLGVRSSFSLLESMITSSDIKNWAIANDIPAVAVTDHNNLFGALEISEYLAGEGVQPIVGVSFDILPAAHDSTTYKMTILAQDDRGYERLMELGSFAYLESQDGVPVLAEKHAFEQTDGLIAFSGGAWGAAGQAACRGKADQVRAALEKLKTAYPGRAYVDIQRHDEAEEIQSEPYLIEAAYELGLPLVAVQDARFLKRSDHAAHDALMCIRNGNYVGQTERYRITEEHYLKTEAEMRELFADLPEAISNTVEVAQRCAVRPRLRDPILPHFDGGFGRSEADELRAQANEGLNNRLAEAEKMYGSREDYQKRLDYELGIIENMGFPGYFLIVSDFIKWAKEHDIPVGPGRGSGAGSLVAWVLLITDLDPLRFGLLFERFLNPERVSMPDFDVDFCQERRGEVIRYVRDKYGEESVASIITFGTLQAKAVVRDVGRVMQMPYGQVDRLSKLIPFNPAKPPKLKDAIADEPKFDEEKDRDPLVGEMLDKALALEGLFRNCGTHAAGVVIGDRPLVKLTPLFRDPRSDLPATQLNMKWAEQAGLVKFDFLGLKTLTVVHRALNFLEQTHMSMPQAWRSYDDEKTYQLMSVGDTLGVFQLEGQGMRDTLKKVQPGSMEDVIAIISLYRPGPMDNIPQFVDVKFGKVEADYYHPLLKPILEETYGVPVYQEQVMRMAQELAGYSLGEADMLRRAMGKKKVEEMLKQRKRFVEGAAEKDVPEKQASHIFDVMEKFAGYGFNKSHAAAYAAISYQTGYLKANHPIEFLAASMSLDIQNTDKLAAFFQEARRLSIPVAAPDINSSNADFDVRDGVIVYALGAIKGVGMEAMKHVCAIREQRPFDSLHDFAERVDPRLINRKCLESLAKAGAFDKLEPNRARALAAVDVLVATASSAADDRAANQNSLFGDDKSQTRAPIPRASVWSSSQLLDHEFKAIGFYLSGHPLDGLLLAGARERITFAMDIQTAAREKASLEMMGIVRARNERPAQAGGKFAWVTFSDPTGEFEAMVPPETLMDIRDDIEVGASVVIRIRPRIKDDEIRLTVDGAIPLEKAMLGAPKGLIVSLVAGTDCEALVQVSKHLTDLSTHERGEIRLEVPVKGGGVAIVALPGKYAVGTAAAQALKSAPGVRTVRELAA